MTAPKLHIQHISHEFEGEDQARVTLALSDIDLQVSEGRFIAIVGPSGCGKTTLFNIIAGLLAPTWGSILKDGEDMTAKPGVVGYQLQRDLLLPWRTIIDNIILGLEIHGMPKPEARTSVLSLCTRKVRRYKWGSNLFRAKVRLHAWGSNKFLQKFEAMIWTSQHRARKLEACNACKTLSLKAPSKNLMLYSFKLINTRQLSRCV